jgi:hypothetical protein
MMNKMVLLTALMLPLNNFGSTDSRLLTFTNPAIHSLDGVTFALDGAAIHDILIVIKKVMSMQGGQKVGLKVEGLYPFEKEKFSISQLAVIEKMDPSNPHLANALAISKRDFIETTKHFMKGIEPVKRLMMSLIKEFCERRNRPDSVILDWANAKSGNEDEIFNQAIKSFANFELFLSDLTFFLKDLVNSCPKAREQYKEWYKKQKLSQEQ